MTYQRIRFPRNALAAAVLAGACLHAHAQTARFEIAAQPLSDALAQFGRQSGAQLVFAPALVQSLRSNAVHGSRDVAAALAELLRGTGLQTRRTGATLTLERVPADAAVTLPPVTVTAAAERETAIGPVIGYVAKRSATATKTDTPLVEIPQSISVIGREEMDARGVQDLMQAIAYMPGVAVNAYGPDNRGWEINLLRGFSANSSSYRDGLARTPFGVNFYVTEPYGLERIEVLRGPASMVFGKGDVGGVIHQVSKQPTGEQIREVELQYGSYQRKQLDFDLGDAFTGKPELSYRLVGVALDSNDQDQYPDGHKLNRSRQYLAPSLRWQPDATTSFTLLAEVLKNKSAEDPYFISGNGVLSNVKMGDYSFSGIQQEQASLGYRFEHRLNGDWTVQQNARYSHVTLDRRVVWVDAIGADGRTVARIARTWNDPQTQAALDTQLQGRLRMGATEHTLLFGMDWNRQKGSALRYIGAAPDLDLLNPVYGVPIAAPQDPLADYTQQTRQLGWYVQDQIKFGGNWVATLGGRQDRVRTRTDDRLNTAVSAQTDNAFSGRAGLSYLLGNGWAPYLGYSESFLPNSGVDSNNQPFQPSRGKQLELGLKFQPEGSRSLFTAALFDLRKSNVVTYDNNTFEARQIGKQRTRGLELEAKAELLRGLNASASYTWLDMKVLQSADSSEVGKIPPLVPKQTAAVWLDYLVGGGFGVGGGISHVGRRQNDEANSSSERSFTLVDAVLHYEQGPWRFALNANNLLDKKYNAICYHGECYQGAERAWTLSAKYRF